MEFPVGNTSSKPPAQSKPTQYVMTGKDTVRVGDQEYRIKQIRVGGKVINFEDLKHSDKEFKEQIMKKAEKSLHHFHKQAQLDPQKGTYTLTLSKESTTLTTKDDENFIREHHKNLDPARVKKREDSLNNLQSKAHEVLKKKEDLAVELKKHTFTKEVPSFLKEAVIKIGVVVGLILLSPVFLVVGGLIHVGLGLKDLSAKVQGQTLQQEANKMKAAEEKAKLEGMGNSVTSLEYSKILSSLTKKDLYSNELMQNKVIRHIERALKRNGQKDLTLEDKNNIKNLLSNLEKKDFKDIDTLKSRLLALVPQLDEILTDEDIATLINESSVIRQDSSSKDFEKLEKLWKSVRSFEKSEDPAITNQLITANLREVINSPMYQALKEDPNNEYVRFVHTLACSIWNGNKETLHAYQEFGKAALKGNFNAEQAMNSKAQVDGSTMRTILEDSHKKTSQELFTDHGIPQKILYAFSHPLQAFGSMASEGGNLRLVAETFGYGVYDSHGELRNNPSLQGTTEATIATENGPVKVTVNNCYGGSPTVGDQISPEFHAICQAAENNQKLPPNLRDPNIPSVIYYTNFQDIENRHGEGERSFAIMELNKKYPLSFVGMTLSKDSDFYLNEGNYKNKGWSGAKEFGNEFLNILQNDKCYQYGNRAGNNEGSGIYLPGGKEAWAKVLPKMIELADKRFEKIEAKYPTPPTLENAEKLRGAYQEYVYSMIQANMEMQIAKSVGERGGSPVLITAIRACKENIDRGGAENAKYIHTRLPPETSAKDHISLTTGCLESRAVSARDRVILEKRLPQVLSFIELVEKEGFREDMEQISKDLGVEFKTKPHFTPSNKPPDEIQDDEVGKDKLEGAKLTINEAL